MKRMIILFIGLMNVSIITAQININPDPYGDPWIAGGVPAMTPQIISEVESIPEFKINPEVLTITLPVQVDNSLRPYMTDIFRQNDNSCSQAAAVGYMFTYEINFVRNIPSDNDSVRYHPSFTYNFLNYSCPDSGTYIHDGLEILKEIGCTSILTYGKSVLEADPKEWISGYDKYFKAMQNRAFSYGTIDLPGDSGLFYVKHWLYDHNSEDTTGGLAVFAAENMEGCEYQTISQGVETGKRIIVSCDTTYQNDAHALTIVGYNDSIRYDIDNNGTIESNEMGAFKIANSWGFAWPPNSLDSGYCYILYSLFSDDSVFLNDGKAYVCQTVTNYDPEITVEAKMTHPNRKYFKAQFGFDTIAGDSMPSSKPDIWPFTNHKSGECSLTGFSYPDDTLEVAFDFTYNMEKYPEMNLGEIYFRPRSSANYQDSSYLWFASMNDYRWNEHFELPMSNTPGTMEYAEEWKFSVDYDLLPFSIVRDTLLETDQIYRLSDTISEGAILTIGSGHTYTELHFHDAELLIEEGSVLHLSSWASIIAKNGTNKIIVKGDLIIAPNAVVKSEGNATLEIYFENDTLNSNFSDCTFEEIEITGFSRSITLDDSHLTGCHLN